jgi:hypothetical protein
MHINGFDAAYRKSIRSLQADISTSKSRIGECRERIMAGEVYCKEQIAADIGLNASYVGKILRLSALGPDFVEDVIAGSRAEFALTGPSSKVPLDWSLQRRDRPL